MFITVQVQPYLGCCKFPSGGRENDNYLHVGKRCKKIVSVALCNETVLSSRHNVYYSCTDRKSLEKGNSGLLSFTQNQETHENKHVDDTK